MPPLWIVMARFSITRPRLLLVVLCRRPENSPLMLPNLAELRPVRTKLRQFSNYLLMNLFTYNTTYQVWVCVGCRYASTPRQLHTHFCSRH